MNFINHWEENTVPIVPLRVNYYGNWSGTDSEENFKKNPNPGYTEKSIEYKYNSWGYRTEPFDLQKKKPGILCLGCSFTEGVGVNQDQSWPSILQSHFTDYRVNNMGVGGGSGDTIARILYSAGEVLNTKIVFIAWPLMHRYELYNHVVDNVTPTTKVSKFQDILVNESHFFNIRQKNKAMVKALCQLRGYKVFEYDLDVVLQNFNNDNKSICPVLDRGRDHHPGPRWHKSMANYFKTEYDNSTI